MKDPNKKRRAFDIDDWAGYDEIPPIDDETDDEADPDDEGDKK
jgi:hypothetical protein